MKPVIALLRLLHTGCQNQAGDIIEQAFSASANTTSAAQPP
jgi:hypothetical protein